MRVHVPAATARRAAAAAIASLALASCGGSSHSAAPGPAATLKVGVSLSLTGDFADPGRAALRGYELWADDVNAGGGILGRQVQLTVLDDKSSPDGAVGNYQRLISQDKVNVVLGPFSSLLTAPSARVAQRYGYAFVEPAGGGPNVFAEKLNNVFFVQQAPVVEEGAVFADYILSLPKDRRPRTAAYTELVDPFAQPIAEYVRARLQAAGIRTVYVGAYDGVGSSLTRVLARARAARPDIIVSGTQSDDAYAEIKAFSAAHYTPRWLYMSNGANSPTEFPDSVGADHVNAVMSSTDWFPDATSASDAEFIRAYLAKYGGTAQNIDPTSAESYSAGMLLADVAEKTGRIDNATIIRALHSGRWSTLLGELSWNAFGEPRGSYTLVQWIHGQLTPVFPRDRAQHAPIG